MTIAVDKKVSSPSNNQQRAYSRRCRFGRFSTRTIESEGDGPTVVALHGFADGAEGWRRTADRFARLGRRFVAVDMPGFANGPPLHQGPVLAQLGRFANEVVEAYVSDGPVVLMGHSMGGCVAIRAAERADTPLAGVVGVGCAGVNKSAIFPILAFPGITQTLTILPTIVPRKVLETGMRLAYPFTAFANPWTMEREEILAYARQTPGRSRVSTYMKIGRRLFAELSDPYQLESVTIPTLLLWGQKDRMSLPTGARVIQKGIPHAELIWLPKSGHHPQIEEPDLFIKHLTGFLDSIVPG